MRAQAFKQALKEFQNDNTIDLQKRTDEIFNKRILQFEKEREENLLSGINKLADKNSDIATRYNEWASKEADEKQAIREEADRILEELKKEQSEREKQAKNVKPSVLNRNDEIKKKIEEAEQAKKIEDIEAAKKRAETLRRANYRKEKTLYDDRQRKLNNFVEQLASINEMENKHVQNNRTSSIKRTQVQNQNVSSSNIRSETSIPERVVIKEVESTPIPKKEEKPVQALVPKKQKPSFMERIHSFGTKVSEAAMTAYEMLTFKHNRDVAVGKRKERTVSPAEASNAYEKNMKYKEYDNSKSNFDVRSKNENKPTSFEEYLAKVDERAAMEAMKSKSKNEKGRERGA